MQEEVALNGKNSHISMRSHMVNEIQIHSGVLSEKLSQTFKKVLIINTGGTISMFSSPNGYITQKGALQKYLQSNPYACDSEFTYFQAKDDCLITPLTAYNRRIIYKIIELDPLIDSSNMNPDYWVTIAHQIAVNYKEFDSFIILHGTDTMSYTASALSFMLQNLSKTVILTGSQVPLSQPRNDGFKNFLNALTIAGHFTIPEVLISFGNKLLRGNRSQKVNSFALESFDSPKFPSIGQFGVQVNINWELIQSDQQQKELIVKKDFCRNVRAIRINPLLNHQVFKDIIQNEKLKGLIIETYGAGNMQTDEAICEEIRMATKAGIIIVNISQCHVSYVEMLYETGIIFQEMGVISGGDMTTEAAITKLSFLLGQNLNETEIREQFAQNLRGEITPPDKGNPQNEPFLVALSEAIKCQTENTNINKDLVYPNILCLLCVQQKPLSTIDITNMDINYSSVDYDSRTILHVAAREGSIEIAEVVLKQAPQIVNQLDRWRHSPMYEAVNINNQEMISLLSRYKGVLIAPQEELRNILMKEIVEGKTEKLETFFKAGVRDFSQFVTQDGRTLAHVAVSVQNNEALLFLRKSSVLFDWNAKDRFGRTSFDEMKWRKRKIKK